MSRMSAKKTKILAKEKCYSLSSWLGYSLRTTKIRKLRELDQAQSPFFTSFFFFEVPQFCHLSGHWSGRHAKADAEGRSRESAEWELQEVVGHGPGSNSRWWADQHSKLGPTVSNLLRRLFSGRRVDFLFLPAGFWSPYYYMR